MSNSEAAPVVEYGSLASRRGEAIDSEETENRVQRSKMLARMGRSLDGQAFIEELTGRIQREQREMLQTDPQHATKMAVHQGRIGAWQEILSWLTDNEEHGDGQEEG